MKRLEDINMNMREDLDTSYKLFNKKLLTNQRLHGRNWEKPFLSSRLKIATIDKDEM